MPQLFVIRPGAIFDFGHKQRPDEDSAVAPECAGGLSSFIVSSNSRSLTDC